MGEGAIPSYDTIDEFVSVVINGLRQIASKREPAGTIDQETINYINDYVTSVYDRLQQITADEEFTTFWQETLVNELSQFGLTEDNMNTITEIWTSRYPEMTPSLAMIDEFVGVLRDGLLKLVAEAADDPVKVFQKQVDNMINSLRDTLEATLAEPIPDGADRTEVQNERFMMWLMSFQTYLMNLGLSEEEMQIFQTLWMQRMGEGAATPTFQDRKMILEIIEDGLQHIVQQRLGK